MTCRQVLGTRSRSRRGDDLGSTFQNRQDKTSSGERRERLRRALKKSRDLRRKNATDASSMVKDGHRRFGHGSSGWSWA
jgi:hypothetical protein